MHNVSGRLGTSQPASWRLKALFAAALAALSAGAAPAADGDATAEKEMKPYVQKIPGTEAEIPMLPIPGGKVLLGSPEGEEGRKDDEGPQVEVEVSPFWMGKYEVTWEQYDIWSFNLDIQRRGLTKEKPTEGDKLADIVMRPTKPYTDMTFSMGHDGFPAICMTQLAAETYCKWLSAKTGRFYRLPTEAEWEYAARAGTKTRYSFGDDASKLDEYAWFFDNSDGKYQKVGKKKPNPWGLHDIHGNVMEWCTDEFKEDRYQGLKGKAVKDPMFPHAKEYSHVARGGSWDDDPEALRSAARRGSDASWKQKDPQIPQSIWYFTDAHWVGFRVVRPLVEPKGWKEAYEKEAVEARKQIRTRE